MMWPLVDLFRRKDKTKVTKKKVPVAVKINKGIDMYVDEARLLPEEKMTVTPADDVIKFMEKNGFGTRASSPRVTTAAGRLMKEVEQYDYKDNPFMNRLSNPYQTGTSNPFTDLGADSAYQEYAKIKRELEKEREEHKKKIAEGWVEHNGHLWGPGTIGNGTITIGRGINKLIKEQEKPKKQVKKVSLGKWEVRSDQKNG